MQHGGDVIVEIAVDQPRQKLILVDVVRDLAVDQIAELESAVRSSTARI